MFVLGKPFQPILMLASKARANPGAPKGHVTWVGSGLVNIRLGRKGQPGTHRDRDKHTGLLLTFVN